MIGGNSFLLFIGQENGLNKWLKHVKREYGKQTKIKIKARETSGDHQGCIE